MAEPSTDLRLAHVLFMDIVGWSKLLINEQTELLRCLTEIVRNTTQVRDAEAAAKLIRLPTGDGMALAFFTNPDAPVRCALEVSKGLKNHPKLPVRMGIHSGPVDEVVDVNQRPNIAGAGITMAQRVMDCGDAGHILVSKRIADDLAHYGHWRPYLHDLGEYEVKHGARINVINFYDDEFGNPATPEKLRTQKKPVPISSKPIYRPLAVGTAIVLAVGLLIGAWFLMHRIKTTSPISSTGALAAEKKIAVLPFKPITTENRDQVLEMGMADSLITKLSSSRQIIVRSLTSVRKYIGFDQDPVAAGRELQVDSILEGNVQKVGDHIRITARLINVGDGSSLWAGTFDEKFTDVFAVQDAISQKVADALALRLSGEEKNRVTKRYTENLTAYQLYLTGRYHAVLLTPPEIREAIRFYQQAIDLDPRYALAYFGLAEANRSLAINADVPSKDCLPLAKAAAKKALEIDDSLAEAHASLSFSLIWFDWDWAGGEREAKHAIAVNPNSAHAHFAYAHVLSDLTRHDEAITEIARARQLDPAFPLYGALEGMYFLHARRDGDALERLQNALLTNSNFWVTHLMLGKVYTQQQKYSEAIDEFTKASELSHGNSEAIASVGFAAARSGNTARAVAVLEQLNNAGHYIPPANLALVYNALGKKDEALAALNQACEERDVRLTLLKVEPRWDSFRSDPHFIAILKRIGLQ
jgi:TolB-like protein